MSRTLSLLLLLLLPFTINAADKLTGLLTSGPWCSVSESTRVVFRADGAYTVGDSGHGRWKVARGRLYMGETELEVVPLEVKRRPKGALGIVIDGEEYARCK